MEKDDVFVAAADVVVVVAVVTMMLTMTMTNTVDHDDSNIVVVDCFKLYFVMSHLLDGRACLLVSHDTLD